MKYMSVDIETTGLKPSVHGITEFAAILADDNPAITHPISTFYRWINPEGYVWSAYCLALHGNWISRLTARIALNQLEANGIEPKICNNIVNCGDEFLEWWATVDGESYTEFRKKSRGTITGTGKNFGTFDLQFLKAWQFPDAFRHRTLDWVPTYTLPGDKVPPDLKLCKERAILMGCPEISPIVAHNALDDAMDVHKLIQFAMKFNDIHRTPLLPELRA